MRGIRRGCLWLALLPLIGVAWLSCQETPDTSPTVLSAQQLTQSKRLCADSSGLRATTAMDLGSARVLVGLQGPATQGQCQVQFAVIQQLVITKRSRR